MINLFTGGSYYFDMVTGKTYHRIKGAVKVIRYNAREVINPYWSVQTFVEFRHTIFVVSGAFPLHVEWRGNLFLLLQKGT